MIENSILDGVSSPIAILHLSGNKSSSPSTSL